MSHQKKLNKTVYRGRSALKVKKLTLSVFCFLTVQNLQVHKQVHRLSLAVCPNKTNMDKELELKQKLQNYDFEMWEKLSKFMDRTEKKILDNHCFDFKEVQELKSALEKLESIDKADCIGITEEMNCWSIYDVYKNSFQNLIIKMKLDTSIMYLFFLQEKIRKMIICSEPLLKQVKHLYCDSMTIKRCIEFELIHEYCQWSELRIKYQYEFNTVKGLFQKFFNHYEERELIFEFNDATRDLIYEGEESYMKLKLENIDGLQEFKNGWVNLLSYLRDNKTKVIEGKRVGTTFNPMNWGAAWKIIKCAIMSVSFMILSSSKRIEKKKELKYKSSSVEIKQKENARWSEVAKEEMDLKARETINYERDKCIYCKRDAHINKSNKNSLAMCPEFQTLTIEQRKLFVIQKNLCLCCFSSEHKKAQCQYRNSVCKRCNGKHHRLLCNIDLPLLQY